jgi:prepilin peptidase CpaA
MDEIWVSQITTAVFFAVVALAMTSDVRTRRIPNALTMAGLIAGLLMRSLLGADALIGGFQGAGLAFLIALPLFLLRGLGGGDVKLLIAVGAFAGPERLLVACALTAVAGGAMALLWALRWGGLVPLMSSTAAMLKYFATFGRSGSRRTLAVPGAMSIPYGVAIGVGSTLAWFL